MAKGTLEEFWPEELEMVKVPKELVEVGRNYDPSTGYLLFVIYAFYEEFKDAMPASDVFLANSLNMGQSTVRRSLRTLKDEGFINLSSAGGLRRAKPNFKYKWNWWEQLQETWKIIKGEVVVENTKEYDAIAVEAMLYWNSKEGLFPIAIPLNHGNNHYEKTEQFSKLEGRLKSLFSGKLFNNVKAMRYWHSKPWTLTELKESIDNFHLAAMDESYEPFNKTSWKKLRMTEFLSAPFFKRMPFPVITYQEKPKFTNLKREEIQSPGLYQEIKTELIQVFKKGIELSPREDMLLIIGSNRLSEVVKSHFHQYMQINLSPVMWAGYVSECLLQILRRGDKLFSPFTTLIQTWFWQSAFPQFLMKKGVLSQEYQKKL